VPIKSYSTGLPLPSVVKPIEVGGASDGIASSIGCGFIRIRLKRLRVGITQNFSGFFINQIVNADDQTNAVAVFDAQILRERDGVDQTFVRFIEFADLIARFAESFF
jgi:hypothetical protein